MTSDIVERTFRDEAGRVLATLIRLLGDFDLAEEAMQDAFAAALAQWRGDGVPENPGAWLIRTGHNRAIDRVRRNARLAAKKDEFLAETAIEAAAGFWTNQDQPTEALEDDLLRLIFTCCHPALGSDAQVALTLRTVCGLTTREVARAFVISEATMAQRLVRAKAKIRVAGIPYRVPPPELLAERLEGALSVIYLVFTEGYAATSGVTLIRRELCDEAIRVARILLDLMPGQPDVEGLLALMLLHDARRDARVSPDGEIVLLEDQDRRLWDQQKIQEGRARVEAVLKVPTRPGPYALQAAIAALHSEAARPADTDWQQIAAIYEVLQRLYPSPIVELNHAVAVSMVDGPERGLRLIDAIVGRGDLGEYHLLPAVRADLLRRAGRAVEAVAAYRRAIELTKLEPERRYLARRLAEVTASIARTPE